MKKYNIYKNISETDFDSLKVSLNEIAKTSSPLMQQYNFYLTKENYNDVLILDYVSTNNSFYGNIGLRYIDEKGDFLFEFYILKAYDYQNTRYYKKNVLPQKFLIGDIRQNARFYFEKCLSIYNLIEKEELIDKVSLRN